MLQKRICKGKNIIGMSYIIFFKKKGKIKVVLMNFNSTVRYLIERKRPWLRL